MWRGLLGLLGFLRRTALRERLASNYPDYDPLIALAEIALDQSSDLSVRIDCHKTIAAYVHPKMRTSAPVEEMDPNIVMNIVNLRGDH